jgi:hypothetical protein
MKMQWVNLISHCNIYSTVFMYENIWTGIKKIIHQTIWGLFGKDSGRPPVCIRKSPGNYCMVVFKNKKGTQQVKNPCSRPLMLFTPCFSSHSRKQIVHKSTTTIIDSQSIRSTQIVWWGYMPTKLIWILFPTWQID